MISAQQGLFIAFTVFFPLCIQQSIPIEPPNDMIVLQGRIVLYDWASHEGSPNDDFVVKTLATRDRAPGFVRVIYKPFWGFDAPAAKNQDILNRFAFVGRGPGWKFIVRAPANNEERGACTAPIPNHKYDDESGSGEIPRFISTPGADIEKLPAIAALPCFVLRRGGLIRLNLTHETPKTGPS
jgi:hypothetical protein